MTAPTVSAALASQAETYPTPEHGWTCFHCGENFPGTFAGSRAARDHFGWNPDAEPACQIKAGDERRLAQQLRRTEAARDLLRHECEELDNDAGNYHGMLHELARYFNGAKSAHQAYLEYDSMEGRAIAAEERAEAAESQNATLRVRVEKLEKALRDIKIIAGSHTLSKDMSPAVRAYTYGGIYDISAQALGSGE